MRISALQTEVLTIILHLFVCIATAQDDDFSGSGTEPTVTTTVEGVPGTHVILLNISKSGFSMATRTYLVHVTGDGEFSTIPVGNVERLFITGLTPEATYTISVTVLDDGVAEDPVINITLATTKTCTLSCTNGHCVVYSPVRSECVCTTGYVVHPDESNICVDVEECQQIPAVCPINTTCSNSDGSFTCRCPSGFRLEDDQCVGVSICDRQPCLNEGSCTLQERSYSCQCQEYYTGPRCEIYNNPCLNVPCQNGGSCIDLSGDYQCQCPTTYSGKNCEEDVDECQLQIFECDPNSQCINTVGSYSCLCDDNYRGDGREKCYLIRLLPYGESEQDEVLQIGDDVASPTIRASFAIPFAIKKVQNFHVISNGLISLGIGTWFVRYYYRPWNNGFDFFDIAVIAPFWDDFHPSENNNGRVYYQVYDRSVVTLTERSEALVQEVGSRINNHFQRDDFNPLFVLKATWHEVVMHYEAYNRGYPSTFQAIIASDGTDTYLIYNYKEDAMLWDTRKRYYWGNRGLIGYNFAFGHDYVETQGDYRPDNRSQNSGGPLGQYFYHVASGISNEREAAARTGCLKWVLREINDPWTPDLQPCPCNKLQALIDRRFTLSVDVWLYWTSRYGGYYRTGSVEEWNYEEARRYNCFQPRLNTGPRCCYALREDQFSSFWGWWSQSPITVGPLASRYERYQIPIIERNPGWSWVFRRDETLFNQQYNLSIENDLVPRRQCCVESGDNLLCELYQIFRPAASCTGYVPRRISFFWGDPHITTNDGVTYSFNGLGEYHMLYAPGVFSLQARTKKAKKEDMSDSDATVFVAFVAKDLTSDTSGTAQFEVDFNNADGDGVIVKVDGVAVHNISDMDTTVSEVSLSLVNGTYTATFPSSPSLSITANNFLLTMQFTGDATTMQNFSKGLMGYWDGSKENDFQFRNGETLNWTTLQPTENMDILNGTLLEKPIYPFGLSWKLFNGSESYFNYTGETGDTFQDHNPTSASEPPFLEDLVAEQRGSSHFEGIRANCTTNNVLSTTCLYDVLTTNRSEIGENTLADSQSSARISETNANALPDVSINSSPHIVVTNGKTTLLARINEMATFTVDAVDADGHEVTYSLEIENAVEGVVINNVSGLVTWTPTSAHQISGSSNKTLTVIAVDELGGQTILKINVKLCFCINDAVCLYDVPVLGSENYQIVDCNCTEAYTGSDCSEDRNGCLLSACFNNVTCTDVLAPGVGETCGDCPEGTTGDGRNCTNINMCDSNPCQHMCESVYQGFICSCEDGYELEELTQCRDVDECGLGHPCATTPYTVCANTIGSYSCVCASGFNNNSGNCEDVNECTTGAHNCSLDTTSCLNIPGSFVCSCLQNYFRSATVGNETSCVDLDECEQGLHTCDNQTEICVNEAPLFSCICKTGFMSMNGTCVDIKECSNPEACDNNTSLCVEEEGSYSCSCIAGYHMTDESICMDTNECLDPAICPTGSSCNNLIGGYECLCAVGVECSFNPRLEPVRALQQSSETITVLVDSFGLYGEYEIKVIGLEGTQTTTTTETFVVITGLKPNSNYSLSARVRKLKNSNLDFSNSKFSDPVSAVTDPVKLSLVVTLVGQTYVEELTNITSEQSVTLRNRFESDLTAGLQSVVGGLTLQFSKVEIIAFRQGSVVASSVGSLITNEASHASVTADGSNLDATKFSDLMTVPTPSTPTNFQITNATTSSLTFGFESVVDAVNYEVKVTCSEQTQNVVVTALVATVNDIAPNEVCSCQVRVLASVGSNAVAYSPYSSALIESTTPAIMKLTVSSITETSLIVSFSSVARATSYHVIASGVTPVHLPPTVAANNLINVQIPGLTQGTTYLFIITVISTDIKGSERNGTDQIMATTSDVNECRTTTCQEHASCSNTLGSYECVCGVGYESNTAGTLCFDINECSANGVCSAFSTCVNTDGSYRCDCNVGYVLDNSDGNCVDLNECMETPSPCPVNATCNNTVGSFSCVCSTGYFFDGSSNKCLGNCITNSSYCQNGATCTNSNAERPECLCAIGFEGERCEQPVPVEGWKIALGVIGGLVLLVIIVAVTVVVYRKNRVGEYSGI